MNSTERSPLFLDADPRGAEKLFLGFHELAHRWLHGPGIQHFHGWDYLVEDEADIVAACALIPQNVLVHS